MADNGLNSIALEDAEQQILEARQAQEEGVSLFTAHMHVFVPSAVLCVTYFAVWYIASVTQISSTPIMRAIIVIFAIVMPLMIAWAFLRFETIRLQVHDDHLVYHTGWPTGAPKELPFNEISGYEVRKGFLANLLGGGDLKITARPDVSVTIRSLRDSQLAMVAIEKAIASDQQ